MSQSDQEFLKSLIFGILFSWQVMKPFLSEEPLRHTPLHYLWVVFCFLAGCVCTLVIYTYRIITSQPLRETAVPDSDSNPSWRPPPRNRNYNDIVEQMSRASTQQEERKFSSHYFDQWQIDEINRLYYGGS